MTDEQINQRIAEACGIRKWNRYDGIGWMYKTNVGWETNCPDYCTDLNAMHEAEEVLKAADSHEYTNLLYDFACKAQGENGKWLPYSIPARQRAEAFLRTLGKWEDGK